MKQQSTPVDSPETVNMPARHHWRWRWFPLFWTIGLLLIPLTMHLLEADRGVKWVSLQAAIGLIVLGLILWFAAASPFRRVVRWGVALALFAVFIAAGRSIDVVNDGDLRPVGIRFIWQPAPDKLLDLPEANATADGWASTPRDYPRFLGNGYWAEVAGVALEPDWEMHPPEEIWRRPVGAGWSSFAIVGDYAITQEQRGASELVVCYRLSTGDVVWTHADEARFDPESMSGGFGGVGPRATPTIVGERVITQGATGLVNCLDARTGTPLWSHDTLTEQGADNLMWGKSGSPLVVDDMIVVNVGAPANTEKQKAYHGSLVAYDLATGEIRWAKGHRTTAYPSPVLATFAGVPQILQINQDFVTAHRASDGEVLWEHEWPGNSSGDASCSQPVPLEGDRLLLTRGYGDGGSLLQIGRTDAGEWEVRPLWSPPVKTVLKTKFGNVLVRDGYVYGLDEIIMQCVELETGRSAWKKRRRPPFGNGQIMLIGDHILVLSESGEVVLVECNPNDFREVASLQALSTSDVTWNNAAFSAPFLLVRNAHEAACYLLPLVE